VRHAVPVRRASSHTVAMAFRLSAGAHTGFCGRSSVQVLVGQRLVHVHPSTHRRSRKRAQSNRGLTPQVLAANGPGEADGGWRVGICLGAQAPQLTSVALAAQRASDASGRRTPTGNADYQTSARCSAGKAHWCHSKVVG